MLIFDEIRDFIIKKWDLQRDPVLEPFIITKQFAANDWILVQENNVVYYIWSSYGSVAAKIEGVNAEIISANPLNFKDYFCKSMQNDTSINKVLLHGYKITLLG